MKIRPLIGRRIRKGTSHLTISMRGQRETGKIQRNNYHPGDCGQALTLYLIFTHQMDRNVKNL